MPGALGMRFALEAAFLILLAVVLGLADLEPLLIILIMGLGWLLVALIEYFAWRQSARFPARYAAAGGIAEEEVAVEEPAPVPPPPVPRSEQPVRETEPAAESPAQEPPPAAAPEDQTMAGEPATDAAGEAEPEGPADPTESLAFTEQERAPRARYRLEPLQPRPRRRWGLFGRRTRPDESASEEER